MYKIILASESPRRKEIMKIMGIPFRAVPSHVVEKVHEDEPSKMVIELAKLKASDVNDNLEDNSEDFIIIGADTMVFYKGQAMGKPKDEADAIRMLKLIADDIHEVYTGIHIIIRRKRKKTDDLSFAVSTKVKVMPLSDEQIIDYVGIGESMDKAGAYAIQGKFGIFIHEIEGDYYNVVGFPIAKIYENLGYYDIDIKKIK